MLNTPSHFYSLDKLLENVLADLNDVLIKGGLVRVNGINVLFDNPDNLNYYGSCSGYYIRNAQDWFVYFKCRDRAKAQTTCDMIFGSGRYFVQSRL